MALMTAMTLCRYHEMHLSFLQHMLFAEGPEEGLLRTDAHAVHKYSLNILDHLSSICTFYDQLHL